ncbi:MAG: hypothetical protein IJ060_13315 [Oscillospiraceae bacterium]|nr:hypothetical protein [Oscillospiraceae bacterium]
MKNTDLLNALRNADPRFVRETEQRAADAAMPKQRRLKPVLIGFAGAAACLGAVLFLLHGRPSDRGLTTASTDPTDQITEEFAPATEIAPEITTYDVSDSAPGQTTTSLPVTRDRVPYDPHLTDPILPNTQTTLVFTRRSADETVSTGTTAASTGTTAAPQSTASTTVTFSDLRRDCAYVHVTYVSGDYMLVKPDSGQWISQYGSLELNAGDLPAGTTPTVGTWLLVYYDGSIMEVSPARFSRVTKVVVLDDPVADPPEGRVSIGADEVYVWHDLIQEQITPTQAIGDDGEYRLKLAAFPDTEFIWRHYGIYSEKDGTETRIIGSGEMDFSSTITPWQVYFTDLNGDSYPEMIVDYCLGYDFYCTQHVMVYDIRRGYSETLKYNYRGQYDYVLRYIDRKMYVEEIAYSEHPALKFAGMSGTLGTIIEDMEKDSGNFSIRTLS